MTKKLNNKEVISVIICSKYPKLNIELNLKLESCSLVSLYQDIDSFLSNAPDPQMKRVKYYLNYTNWIMKTQSPLVSDSILRTLVADALNRATDNLNFPPILVFHLKLVVDHTIIPKINSFKEMSEIRSYPLLRLQERQNTNESTVLVQHDEDNDTVWSNRQCCFCHVFGHGLENGEGMLNPIPVSKRWKKKRLATKNAYKELYAHEYCLWTAPQVYFDHKSAKISGVEKTLDSRQFKSMYCSYCNKKGGAMLGCPAKGCRHQNQYTTLHLLCAMKSGGGFTGTNGWRFYCKNHISSTEAKALNAVPAKNLQEWTHMIDTVNHEMCLICRKYDDGSTQIECDRCGAGTRYGWHLACLGLKEVPSGEWICPKCTKKKHKHEKSAETGKKKEADRDLNPKETCHRLDRNSFNLYGTTVRIKDFVLIHPFDVGDLPYIGRVESFTERRRERKDKCRIDINVRWMYRKSDTVLYVSECDDNEFEKRSNGTRETYNNKGTINDSSSIQLPEEIYLGDPGSMDSNCIVNGDTIVDVVSVLKISIRDSRDIDTYKFQEIDFNIKYYYSKLYNEFTGTFSDLID